jgi:phage tail sheath gpL-like
MPISAPSGSASTYKLKVYVAGSNPAKAGTLQLCINSVQLPGVGFTTTDTNATIATALAASINSNLDLPCTASASTDTVTVTYIHNGTTGEDLPLRCFISPSGSGVELSVGQALFIGAAGASGSVSFTFGAQTVTTAIANTTAASAIATAVAASFNADTYSLYAKVDGGTNTQVNLFMANSRDVRRVSADILTTTTTTVNLGSGATDGTGSAASVTYNGTVGTGAPAISAALTNLSALGTFRSWASPWLDATTVGAMATNIEAASDGSISGQKQQHLTMCDARAISVAGALAPATTPNLTTTAPHYAVCWSPDCPVQGMGISARVAAARASKWLDTPQFNWNGFIVQGSSRAPILGAANIPSLLIQNSALRTYALAPVVKGDSGNLQVVKGRTTSLANDKRLWAWSVEAQAAYHAVDLALYFKSLFQGGSIVQYSEPKSPGIFDALSFKSATQTRMSFWEKNGNYDGAALLSPAVKAAPDGNNPFRMNVDFPESPVLDLDQVVFASHFSQPST